MNYNLTGATVSSTYGRLVQTINGSFYDGYGNLLNPFGATNSNISVLWTGDWNQGMNYYMMDAVKYNGNTYVCIQQHLSDTFNSPDQLTNVWSLFTVSTIVNSSTFLYRSLDFISAILDIFTKLLYKIEIVSVSSSTSFFLSSTEIKVLI